MTPAVTPNQESQLDVFSPENVKGKIPASMAADYYKMGFRPAVRVTSPEGVGGWLPSQMVHDYISKGFKLGPPEQQQLDNPTNMFGLPSRDDAGQPPPITAEEVARGKASHAQNIKYGYPSAVTGDEGGGGPGDLAIQGLQEGAKIAAKTYLQQGPGQIGQGGVDIAKGNFSKGGHEIISGAGVTALPLAPEAIVSSPLRFGLTAGAAYGTGKATKYGAAALGANPEQQQFAEDVGNLGGGYLGSKAPNVLQRMLLLGKTPAGAYESALKPSTTIPAAQRQQLSQTGLREGIPISRDGLDKLSGLIDDVNNEISNTIQSDPNRPINPAKAVQNLRDTRQKFATQVNPTKDLQAIDDSGQEFMDQFRAQPGGAVRNMKATEAQAMKQGTYRVLAGKYGEQGSASTEAQKALARGLKEELANQFPELSQLNARDGSLLDLQDSLERAVNRIGNHQLMGIGTPVVAGAARAVTGSNKLGAVAGIFKGVLDNPYVKSRLAIAISKASGTPLPLAAARLNNYAATLSAAANFKSDDQDQQDFRDKLNSIGKLPWEK